MRRVRIAMILGFTGVLLLALAPIARTASASSDGISDYAASGFARGAQLAFTFSNSIFPQLLDFDVPFASANADSQAGGEADALASALYPGNLIASQAAGYPGIQESHYPPGGAKNNDLLPFPGAYGPIEVHAGNMSATANAEKSTATATAGRVAFGYTGAPTIDVSSLKTTSSIGHDSTTVTQSVSSVASGIMIDESPSFRIYIASVTSSASATSDALAPTVSSRLNIGAVTVTINGSTYSATIDRTGIHLSGFPAGVPSDVFLPLDLNFQSMLNDAGISIRTGAPVKIVSSGNAESSISGLVIAFTGTIPLVRPPDAITEAIATVESQLPPQTRSPICFQQYSKQLPPLCISAQALPGPGTSSITTLSFGNVDANVSAVPNVPSVIHSSNGGGGGGSSTTITPGTYIPGSSQPGYVIPGSVRGSTTSPQHVVTVQSVGVMSHIKSGPLAIAGIILSVLAVLLGLGPSLRRWLLPAST
ncbi:MAG: hypothetical protein ACYDCC_06915 [Actinomycetota bacterium]